MPTLAEQNRWVRDASIRPLPFPDHGYTLPSMGAMKLLSVTSLVNMFFEGFNADRVIECMMRSAKWGPSHKYYGMTAQAIKEIWACRGTEAAEMGTRMHAAIECYYNCGPLQFHADTLATREFAQFQRFVADATFSRMTQTRDDETGLPDVWIPYRTEWTVYDESARVGGTVDMVYKNVRDGTYTLIDWKRCKELHTTGRLSAKGVMAHMRDCNFTRYSLQLGIYRYILENVYGLVVRDAFVVQFHPDLENYQMHRVPSDTELYRLTVPKIMQSLRRGATESGNWELELASLLAPPTVPTFAADRATLCRSDSWDTGTVRVADRDDRESEQELRDGALRMTL